MHGARTGSSRNWWAKSASASGRVTVGCVIRRGAGYGRTSLPMRWSVSPESKVAVKVDNRQLTLSNLDKVLYPEVGFTKGQVIDYYTRIAPVLLPHTRDHPLTLKRYPNGVDAEFFYEKNCPKHRPPWVETATVWSGGNNRDMYYCLCQDVPTLVRLAHIATLEFHTSLSLAKNLPQARTLVFDPEP